jgi:hypothetical protein
LSYFGSLSSGKHHKIFDKLPLQLHIDQDLLMLAARPGTAAGLSVKYGTVETCQKLKLIPTPFQSPTLVRSECSITRK